MSSIKPGDLAFIVSTAGEVLNSRPPALIIDVRHESYTTKNKRSDILLFTILWDSQTVEQLDGQYLLKIHENPDE
ncbi:MAG TPA: hypothetical protein EYF95_08455 [Flavobacteriales bacterium]|nr:hypothetical protein [Flavobacteriales bacterium]